MFKCVLKPSHLIGDHPLTDSLFLHIAWKYKISQLIRDNPLWQCPLRAISNFVCSSYIYIYTIIYNYTIYIHYNNIHVWWLIIIDMHNNYGLPRKEPLKNNLIPSANSRQQPPNNHIMYSMTIEVCL